MAASAKQPDWSRPVRMTEDEYLAFEEQALERHEFYDGFVRPLGLLLNMAGGTFEHSLIINNVSGELRERLKGTGCRVLNSDIRVKPKHVARYSYPDVTVQCGEPEFDGKPGSRTAINNPLVVVEVMSPGTMMFDRTKKLQRYWQIESLRECVLVETSHPFVQTIYRRDGGDLGFDAFDGMDAIMKLRSVNVTLPLAEIYRDVTFPPPPVLPFDAEDVDVPVIEPE